MMQPSDSSVGGRSLTRNEFGRVLVTGGTGFIGTALVARLLQAHDHVRVLSRRAEGSSLLAPAVEWVRGDIRDAGLVRRALAGVDTVFHLAGLHSDEPECPVTNIDGTRTLAAAARCGVRRLVYASSVKAIAETTDEEGRPRGVVDAYGQSKQIAEATINELHAAGVHTCNLRLALVWGPGSRGNFYRLVAGIDQGWFPPLPRLTNRRSLVHVDDVAEAALLAAGSAAASGKSYVVTDGIGYSSTQLYAAIAQALGKTVPRMRLPLVAWTAAARAGDALKALTPLKVPFDSARLEKLTGSAFYDSTPLRRDLGFAPGTIVAAGLPAFIEWYRADRRAARGGRAPNAA